MNQPHKTNGIVTLFSVLIVFVPLANSRVQAQVLDDFEQDATQPRESGSDHTREEQHSVSEDPFYNHAQDSDTSSQEVTQD